MTEIVDRDQPLIAGPYEADLVAYVDALAAAGLEVDPTYIECRLVCDELQMAGTADRILVRTSDGGRLIADLKTGETVDYGGLGWAAPARRLRPRAALRRRARASDWTRRRSTARRA